MQDNHIKRFIIQRERMNIMTLQQSQMKNGQSTEEKSTSSLEDSHVKPFQLRENVEDFQTLEEHFFSTLQERPNKSNHAFYSLKTLKGYYLTTRGKHSPLSFQRWMNSGIMLNGKCLTQKIMVSHKTENGYSLSDILEDQVEEKYYLSEEKTKQLKLK